MELKSLTEFIQTGIMEQKKELLMMDEIIGILIPRNWLKTLREENPDWNLPDDIKYFELMGVPVKPHDSKQKNLMWIETMLTQHKIFHSM